MRLRYSKHFKEEVKRIYNSPQMDQLAEQNNPFLGKWLDRDSPSEDKRKLYNLWCKEMGYKHEN